MKLENLVSSKNFKEYSLGDLFPVGKKMILDVLNFTKENIKDFEKNDDDTNEDLWRQRSDKLNISLRYFLYIVKTALTGDKTISLIFDIIRKLGNDECQRRLDLAIKKLNMVP